MNAMYTEHPRAKALHTQAAEHRWPYTRVMDWLSRDADSEKDHASLPPIAAPSSWVNITGEKDTILHGGKPHVLALNTSAGNWNEHSSRIHVPSGANATLVISIQGDGVVDFALNLHVEAEASLTIVRIAQLGATARAFENITLDIDTNARVRMHDFNLEQGLSHLDLQANLNGEAGDVQLDSLSLLCGRSRAVLQATVSHAAESATSRLEFRNALADRARRSVTGAVHVTRLGQHTDSSQICRSLLLSPTAGADMRPELEIFADQVKCAHGATCGELDQTAMHYLRSRGIDPLTARRLLLESFALPMLAELPSEVKEVLDTGCHNTLSRLGQQLTTPTSTGVPA